MGGVYVCGVQVHGHACESYPPSFCDSCSFVLLVGSVARCSDSKSVQEHANNNVRKYGLMLCCRRGAFCDTVLLCVRSHARVRVRLCACACMCDRRARVCHCAHTCSKLFIFTSALLTTGQTRSFVFRCIAIFTAFVRPMCVFIVVRIVVCARGAAFGVRRRRRGRGR